VPKIINKRYELVKLCHSDRSGSFFFETQCIFQQSLHDGIVPGDWHKANITPDFKKWEKY